MSLLWVPTLFVLWLSGVNLTWFPHWCSWKDHDYWCLSYLISSLLSMKRSWLLVFILPDFLTVVHEETGVYLTWFPHTHPWKGHHYWCLSYLISSLVSMKRSWLLLLILPYFLTSIHEEVMITGVNLTWFPHQYPWRGHGCHLLSHTAIPTAVQHHHYLHHS